jgi:hypothetical protein
VPAPPAQIQGYEVAIYSVNQISGGATQTEYMGHVPMSQLHMELAEHGGIEILLTLNASSGQGYMLDCGLGPQEDIGVFVNYFSTNVSPYQYFDLAFWGNGNQSNQLGVLGSVEGEVSTTSGHILIPIAAGPAHTASIGVMLTDPNALTGISPILVNRTSFAINGCTLDVVNPQ